jgi:surfactin synthase thioesterase subunit
LLLVVAGHRPPDGPATAPPFHGLTDSELLEALQRLGGLPPEMLEHTELIQLLLPALRADFEACETYGYSGGAPLDCPLLAIGGEGDPLAPWPEMSGWRRHTSGEFRAEVLPGDHFFIHTARVALLRLIATALAAPYSVGLE